MRLVVWFAPEVLRVPGQGLLFSFQEKTEIGCAGKILPGDCNVSVGELTVTLANKAFSLCACRRVGSNLGSYGGGDCWREGQRCFSGRRIGGGRARQPGLRRQICRLGCSRRKGGRKRWLLAGGRWRPACRRFLARGWMLAASGNGFGRTSAENRPKVPDA